MSAERDAVLTAVRKSLGRGPLSADQAATLGRRLKARAPNPIPARGQVGRAERVALFAEEAARVDATVTRVDSAADVPAAVADYLASHNLPTTIKAASGGGLEDVPWAQQPALTVTAGRGEDADLVGVTGAFAGVAETGTLVLASSGGSPTTLNFLPDTHIAVIRADDIVGTYEDAWSRLRAATDDANPMPRTINLVTGPSRTADIEQTLLLGAHGPRRLHIVVVDADEA